MKIEEFGNLLVSIAKLKFPDANITITEKRKITLEARIKVSVRSSARRSLRLQ